MFHLAAYYESQAISNVLTALAAVADQSVTTSGDDIRVPKALTNLLGEAGLTASTSPVLAQVQSASLRTLANQDVLPIADALVFSEVGQLQWHGDNPRALEATESLNFAVNANDSTAAGSYGLVWLGDGPPKPTQGKIFSAHATAAITLSAGVWVNGALTFDTKLPAGTYQVVGVRAQGAHLVAARIVFIGQAFRPGVIGEPALDTNYAAMFRMGKVGVFGEFDIDQQPTVDCLGATDTAQDFIFDLIKVK